MPPEPAPPAGSPFDPSATLAQSSAEILRRLEGSARGPERYRNDGEIARGAMGAILKVWDGTLKRKLAMKVVLSQRGEAGPATTSDLDPKSLGRFLEEAQVTGQLDHPGIVPVHELGLDAEGRVYFTMRLVRGRDLKAVFDLVHAAQEGWNQTRALHVMLKVCEAMAFAHEKGVIHRDLKPANVMVGRFGEVYVMDWGLARVLGREDVHDLRLRRDESGMTYVESERRSEAASSEDSVLYTMDGDVVGTPAYMSPEQARGLVTELDRRTDVYSTGAMLYHLLAGQMPFVPPGARVSPQTVVMRVLEGPPRPLAELAPAAPTELVAITEKAMARRPAERYADMQELAWDLRAFLEHRVVKAYETGAVAEFKKWVKRNRSTAAASAAALLALVVGLVASSALFVRAEKSAALAEERRGEAEENEGKARAAMLLARENAAEARTNAELAREREIAADQERVKVLRLADGKRLERLRADAALLWPAVPARVPDYEAWLARADELVARLPLHREAVAELEGLGQRSAEDDAWTFANAEEQWQHDLLLELVADLEAFADPAAGLVALVRARLAFAETVERDTVTGSEARLLWARAIASIASPAECPAYEGLLIEPQLGFVPLGRDPRSGLWEFAHLQTGTVPERDADGALVLDESTALVLVLLPGGEVRMGAQSADVGAPGYDPYQELDRESPPNRVALAPFFLAKHELTQGQWSRIARRNPSAYPPSTDIAGTTIDLRHPVEQVTWRACDELLRNLGLALPTEAQWEYGARAGTDTPWWTGADRDSLEGVANLADQTAAKAGATWPAIRDWPELEDGFALHAPVGALPPNPFGLHEVHGNVWEWCRDPLTEYAVPADGPEGLRPGGETGWRMYRGGSYLHNAASARSAFRDVNRPDYSGSSIGVRPARRLEATR